MARAPRMEVECGIHHAYGRGNRREAIFLDDADRHIYLRRLGKTVVRMGWSCLAYCLMGNHVHLLVETFEPNLGAGMQRLHGGYAQGFNRRHGRSGHLFQGRFGAEPVEGERQLLMALGYIAHNPPAAGLCHTAEEWRWSSHGAMAGGFAPAWLDVARVYEHLASFGGDPRRRYRELVASRG